MKSEIARRNRRFFAALVPALLFIVIAGSICYAKKGDLIRRFEAFIENRVWKSLGLRIEVQRLGGNIWGNLSFGDVSVYMESADGPKTVFRAEKISFQYKPADLFSQKFAGWLQVVLDKPTFYADAPFRPNAQTGAGNQRSIEIFSKVAGRVRNGARLVIKDGRISWRGMDGVFSGIEGMLEDRRFALRIGLNHLKFGMADLSSDLLVNGQLEERSGKEHLSGVVKTRGTVINWKPLSKESRLRFALREDGVEILNGSTVAGVQIRGVLPFEGPMDMLVKARNYPLNDLNDVMVLPADHRLTGRADLAIRLSGSGLQPSLKGHLIIKDAILGGKAIRNMQLSLEGVLPELRISESRIVLADGTAMQMATQNLNVMDLFNSKTYEQLVSRHDQDDVIWKDWRLTRRDTGESMAVEREIGEQMKVKYERTERDESNIKPKPEDDEVELEYLLSGSETLNMKLKDDEQVFGVQRKVSF